MRRENGSLSAVDTNGLDFVADTEKTINTTEATRKRFERVNNILEKGEIEIPEDLKLALKNQMENIFSDYSSERKGESSKKYLEDKSGASRIIGASMLLEEKLEKSQTGGGVLSDEEIKEVRQAFIRAAEACAQDETMQSGEELDLKIIAENVDKLAEIMMSAR